MTDDLIDTDAEPTDVTFDDPNVPDDVKSGVLSPDGEDDPTVTDEPVAL